MISSNWLLYSFETLTCWWYWLILLIVLVYWFCFCHDYLVHFDMYVHIVVYLIVIVLTPLLIYYLDHLWACYPCCYSSWLLYSRLACVWTWMIYLLFVWLLVAWLLFSCVFACCLFVRAAHLSPYLQPSSFDHFLHFDFIFANMRPCVCLFL